MNQKEEAGMAINGINHAVLYVRDARRTQKFYSDVLGFTTVIDHPQASYVFMRAPDSKNHHDIAFFTIGADKGPSQAGRSTVGMYHIAWEVPTLADLEQLREKLTHAGVLVGQTDHGVNKSLYAHDPDGLEFEVTWIVPAKEWGAMEDQAIIEPLDMVAERRKFEALGYK